MRVAFTLDDIPLWPRSHPPAGYSVASIMQKISDALVRNGIRNVYGFGNSWSLVQHPELGTRGKRPVTMLEIIRTATSP